MWNTHATMLLCFFWVGKCCIQSTWRLFHILLVYSRVIDVSEFTLGELPSGKLTQLYGKSPCLTGKSTTTGPFSLATLNYQQVGHGFCESPFEWMVQYRTTIGATASIIQESGGSSCSALKDMAMGPGCFHIQMAMLGPNPKVVKHAQTVALIDVVCQKCSSLVSHPDFNKPCIMESSKKGSSTIKFQIVSVFIQKHRQHSLANCVFRNQSQGAKNQRCAASRPLVQHIVLTVKNVLWRTKVKTATFRPWSQLREVVLLEPLQYNILWLLEPFIPARSLTVLIQEGCSTRSTTALVDVGSVHLFWSSEAFHPYPNWCKSNNGDSCRKRVPLTTRKKSEW